MSEPNETREEKLLSLRTRIKAIREQLEKGSMIVSISIPDFSATYDRKGALEELALLERQERNLMYPGRRFRPIILH